MESCACNRNGAVRAQRGDSRDGSGRKVRRETEIPVPPLTIAGPPLPIFGSQKKWGPALLPAPTAPSTDMSVFATRSAEASPSLDPDSPAQASLPIAAARESLAFSSFPSRRKFRLGPLMSRPKAKQLRCSTALLGMITSASRFALPTPRGVGAASRKRKIISSGASSRLATNCPRGNAPIACRQRSVLRSLPHLLARKPSGGDCDRRPDHLKTMHFATSRAKGKIGVRACG